MTHPLISALAERHALPTVDASTIDAFLAPAEGEARHGLLFFAGDPGSRAETLDVAVVLPEILAALAEQGFSPRGRGLLRVDLDEKFKGLGSPVRETLTRFAWHELHLPCLQVEIHAQLRDVQAQSELKRTAAALRALVLAAAAAAADCCSKSHGTTLK
jgi:hypothetical protein